MKSVTWRNISILFYVVSLALPAYRIECGGAFLGIFALILGPIDLLAFHVPWLANVALLSSWVKLRRAGATSFFLALLALGLAATFGIGQGHVIIAGGSCSSTYRASLGYHVWIASILVQLIASAFSFLMSQSDEDDLI